MRKFYFGALLLAAVSMFPKFLGAQCNLLPNAIPGIILDYQSTNLLNCSGVGYNPILMRYYGVRAGNPGFPLETWSSTGTQLYTTTAGFDWRGMWWNPNTSQLEGNGYNTSGLWKANLNASGFALNTGVSLFTGMAQPDAQSCGDYDPVANEIIYYFNGRIYRYSRATNAAISNYALVGCPVGFGNLNSTTVLYTGCAGKEIGVLDYVLKRVYLFQKNTGTYVGMCQLPATAVTTGSFRTSWANGFLWLFDLGTGNWFSYQIFDLVLPVAVDASGVWTGPHATEISWESHAYANLKAFEVERSSDAIAFERIGGIDAANYNLENDGLRQWSFRDAQVPSAPVIYYRVKCLLENGEVAYSDVVTLTAASASAMDVHAWPVPADDKFTVSFSEAKRGTEMEVVDLSGKVILKKTVTAAIEKAGMVEIETRTWADGIYMMRIQDQEGKYRLQRLVIQH